MGDFSVHVTGVDHVIRETFKASSNLERATLMGARTWAGLLENNLKLNAPWTDRTANARNGLQAEAGIDIAGVVVVARHTVTYGVFLELANGGKYAILAKQMRRDFPQLGGFVAAATKAAGF